MATPPTNAKKDQNRTPSLLAVSSSDGFTPVPLEANPLTGGLLIEGANSGTIINVAYDYLGVTYPNATTEVYTYRTSGSGGIVVATVTITYTDSTKANIVSMART